MLYRKELPLGVDIPIQKLQEHLHQELAKLWGIEDKHYNSFCRIYKNPKPTGDIPEFYIGNNEYREAFFDDKVFATSFFVVDDNVSFDKGVMTAKVSLIFCVDLSKLKPEIKHRADEEARLDVVENCQHYGFVLNSISTGMNSVFREFDRTKIKYTDMHPRHCFRLNMTLSYRKC